MFRQWFSLIMECRKLPRKLRVKIAFNNAKASEGNGRDAADCQTDTTDSCRLERTWTFDKYDRTGIMR